MKHEHFYNLDMLFEPQNYLLHLAIALIAITLLWTLIHEMRKPGNTHSKDEKTKKMNEILHEE